MQSQSLCLKENMISDAPRGVCGGELLLAINLNTKGDLFYPKVQWLSGGSWNPLSSSRNSIDPAGLTVVGMDGRGLCVFGVNG